jgi:hypothetical protein
MYAKHAEELRELELNVELNELTADGASHAREPRGVSMGL